jgi:hypothetical protein
MRDIRADLKERLNTIAQKRTALQVSLKELETVESGIQYLLQLEDGLFAVSQNGNGNHAIVADTGTELAQFILRTLRGSPQPLSLDDLKEAAVTTTNIDFGDKKPGRVIHWALVGMARHDIVEKRDEKWVIMEGKSQEPAEAGS